MCTRSSSHGQKSSSTWPAASMRSRCTLPGGSRCGCKIECMQRSQPPVRACFAQNRHRSREQASPPHDMLCGRCTGTPPSTSAPVAVEHPVGPVGQLLPHKGHAVVEVGQPAQPAADLLLPRRALLRDAAVLVAACAPLAGQDSDEGSCSQTVAGWPHFGQALPLCVGVLSGWASQTADKRGAANWLSDVATSSLTASTLAQRMPVCVHPVRTFAAVEVLILGERVEGRLVDGCAVAGVVHHYVENVVKAI